MKIGKLYRPLSLLLVLLMTVSVITVPVTALGRSGITYTSKAAQTKEYYTGSYYDGIDTHKNGDELRADIAKLITETHTTYTYYDDGKATSLLEVFKTTDADPNKSGNIYSFYTGSSVSFSGWTGGEIDIDREHVWPKNSKSDGTSAFPEKTGPGADAHHLRPCDASVNRTKGNKFFGEVAQNDETAVKYHGSIDYENRCYQKDDLFYPGEGYRGATARILMYMQVRWGDEYGLGFVDFVDIESGGKTIGKISDLMKWHLTEPPTEAEMLRNEEVYKIQGNRNPFIDHPEYAQLIYCYDGESYCNTLSGIVEEYGSYIHGDITSITFSQSSMTVAAGQTYTIRPSVTPAGSIGNVVYTSDNESVATAEKGQLTAKKAGTAVITASSADDTSIKARLTVTVKNASSVTVTGTPQKTQYRTGDTFDPTGLSVTVTYSDSTQSSININDCKWSDARTGLKNLANGTKAVTCSYGGAKATVGGIHVKSCLTISSESFVNGNGSSYTWCDYESDGIFGSAYAVIKSDCIQVNQSKKSYIMNNDPFDGIVSITVKLKENERELTVLTSKEPFGKLNGEFPQSAHSYKLNATVSGSTLTLNTSDKYFAICSTDGKAVYISSIEIEYSELGDPRIEYAKVSLDKGICMQYFVKAEHFEKYPYCKVEAKYLGKTYSLTDSEKVTANSEEYRVFTLYDISPAVICEDIEAALYYSKNGIKYDSGAVNAYGVYTYCYDMLGQNDTTPELKKVIVDLLNYGSAAQEYIGYKTEGLANANLTETQKGFGTTTVKDYMNIMEYKKTGSGGADFVSASVNLGSGIGFRFFFETESVTGLTAEIEYNGQKYTVNGFENAMIGERTYQSFDFNELKAGNLNGVLTVRLIKDGKNVSGDLKYNVESYAYAMQDHIPQVLRALMNYINSSDAYFGN